MLGIDCPKIEHRPTGPGRWLLNILRHWPSDFPARLYFRREIPDYEFLKQKPFNYSLLTTHYSLQIDPLWRHFVLPRALKRDRVDLFFEIFYIPLLMFPPEKTVLAIADISYKRHPEWYPWRSQLRWFPDRLVKRVRHVITISEFSKREIMDYYGISEERITVTPLAADEKFRPLSLDVIASEGTREQELFSLGRGSETTEDKQSRSLAADDGIAAGATRPRNDGGRDSAKRWRFRRSERDGGTMGYLLFWGDLNTRRHPREMIAAFMKIQNSKAGKSKILQREPRAEDERAMAGKSKILQREPRAEDERAMVKIQNLSFSIVGRDITNPPQYVDQLIKKANRALGRRAIVRYEYPSDEELLRLIQGALAVVYLSDYEGFGLPVLEAMACGVPVITSRTSSLPEVGGDAVLYVEDNANVEEIAAAMRKIAEDASLRERLSAKGLERARTFSWARTAETTIRVLRELV